MSQPPLRFLGMSKVYVYIDAFNFYYGCLQGTPYRWVNPLVLCQYLLANDTIAKVKYFTALVSARQDDPGKPDAIGQAHSGGGNLGSRRFNSGKGIRR